MEPLPVLDRWLGRVSGRVALLGADVRTIGLAVAPTAQAGWVCVIDPMRGRGEPVVVFPAPKQERVPIAFSGGAEVPDAKAAARLPDCRHLSGSPTDYRGQYRVARRQGSRRYRVDLDTREAGVGDGPAQYGGPHPEALPRSHCQYQVKASARVDGKPWQLAWSFRTEDDSDSDGAWAKKALTLVNEYRGKAGLPAVALDEKLSRACLAHARYLVINTDHPATLGLKAHDEDPTLPGASKEGRLAGLASDIAIGDYVPLDGVDSWMATLYHRSPCWSRTSRPSDLVAHAGRVAGSRS